MAEVKGTALVLSEVKAINVNPRSALMRRFNESFPPFYSQFASSEVQAQNLSLAYALYQTRKAIVQFSDEHHRTVLVFAYRNQSFLLSDIFGILTAFNLTIHSVNLYGQVYSPHLVFMRIVISRNHNTLTSQTKLNLERAIHEALAGVFEVEEMLSLEFNLHATVSQVNIEFYIDQIFHLPAILVESDNQPGLLYKIMYALWQEDLLVININMIVRKDRTRFILYLLGPNATLIPDYLGQKIATSLKQRLTQSD